MTLSAEARQAAAQLYDDGWPDTMTCASVIQQVIDTHERDLVEALKKYLAMGSTDGRLERQALRKELSAALKKRGIA